MARLVLSSSQWPGKHGECDSPCVWIFTSSESRGACTCNLAGTLVSWRSRLRLRQTAHQVSAALCVSCRGILSNWSKTCWAQQNDPNIGSWAELGPLRTQVQSFLLRAVCSLLLSSRPPTDTLLTNACCTAQISRHSANLYDQLLCVPFFPSL